VSQRESEAKIVGKDVPPRKHPKNKRTHTATLGTERSRGASNTRPKGRVSGWFAFSSTLGIWSRHTRARRALALKRDAAPYFDFSFFGAGYRPGVAAGLVPWFCESSLSHSSSVGGGRSSLGFTMEGNWKSQTGGYVRTYKRGCTHSDSF